MSHDARVVLTIPNGGASSPALSSVWSKGQVRSTLGNTESMTVYGPAALTGAVKIEVAPKYGGGVWKTLSKGGADVTIAAAKATTIEFPGGIQDMRFTSAGAEGAARDIEVLFNVKMD
jgi:hypothetical protein